MTAVLSPCGRYRYQLARHVPKPTAKFQHPITERPLFIGINPSTADATKDDATVRKWMGFSRHWGYHAFMVGNLFAWRATDVHVLSEQHRVGQDIVGPDNNTHLKTMMEAATVIIPCWGTRSKLHHSLHPRIAEVARLLRSVDKPVRIFGLTHSGDPKHPLMLGYDTQMVSWEEAYPKGVLQ